MSHRDLRWVNKQTHKEAASIYPRDDSDMPEAGVVAGDDGTPKAGGTETLPLDNEEDTLSHFPNPAELTIQKVKELNLSEAGWIKLLEAEQAGQRRKGVIDHVTSILGG